MKNKIISLVLLFALFALSIQQGFAQKEIHAYVFLAEECPISIYMTKILKETADQYDDHVKYFAVFPNSRSNYKTMGQFIEKYGLDKYQRILDEDQSISRKYGATITPEVVLTDLQGEILYRGQISNAFQRIGKRKHGSITNFLGQSIQDILRGQNIKDPWPAAVGCFITFHKKSF